MPLKPLSLRVSIAASLFLASIAAAQVDVSAPGTSSPGVVIEPPTSAGPADRSQAPLSSSTVRANTALTTNALIGYVNSEPVFAQDIFRPIDEDLRRIARSSNNFRRDAELKIRNQILEYRDESLVVTTAQGSLTDNDRQVIELNMNKVSSTLLSKYGGSEAIADKALAATGSTLQKEMARTRRELIYYIYMNKNIDPKVVVTRQMVIDAYEKDPTRWEEKGSVELFNITIPVVNYLHEPSTNGPKGPIIQNPTADQIRTAEEEAMVEAKKIVAELKKGADFARMAEDKSADLNKSRGGRTASVEQGSLENVRFEKYVFSLPAHTMGEPILLHDDNPRRSSVVIVKIGDKKEPRTVSFEEAQAPLKKSLEDQQRIALRSERIEQLTRGGAVEGLDALGLDRMVRIAVDAAVTRYATH